MDIYVLNKKIRNDKIIHLSKNYAKDFHNPILLSFLHKKLVLKCLLYIIYT